MMRRGFWLAAGAVLGVAGYRKASRVARSFQPPAITRAPVPGRMVSSSPRALRAGGGEARPPVPVAARIRSAASFAHDVREGMAEYRELHGRQLGRSLGNQRDRAPGRSRQRGSIEP
jgi:hypothetical protein